MHIQVQTLTGNKGNFSLDSTTNVNELRSQIESSMGIPVNEQKLIFNGKSIVDGSLSDNGISEDANIYLIVSIEGGKGKKKKKKTKKPKKKHKKKKVKLAILKYFKVDGDKVVRLRQPCGYCPPGTFIAEHKDRLYCGRCHNAYQKIETGGKGGDKKEGKKKGK